MTTPTSSRTRRSAGASVGTAFLLILIALAQAGCGGPPSRDSTDQGTWAGRRIGPPPAPRPATRQAMIRAAEREWAYFGRQNVIYTENNESIPHVGLWEDDDAGRISRVGLYWQAVGKPGLSGRHCQEPWSAAFMSWLMQSAGVPEYQFPPAAAHWVYLSDIIDWSASPGRYFVPRAIGAYRPQPGDVICASKEISRASAMAGQLPPWALSNARMHCDLVVKADGRALEAIGGNVRNAVSRSVLELDGNGHLQPVASRPWVLVLENRL